MKTILRSTLLFIFALIAHNHIWNNFTFEEIPLTIFKVAIILSLFELILKPIVKILLLPINLITLGLFRVVIDTLGLYIATTFIPDFRVNDILSAATNFQGFTIPELHFANFFAYLVSSLTLSFLIYIYNLILNKKKGLKNENHTCCYSNFIICSLNNLNLSSI